MDKSITHTDSVISKAHFSSTTLNEKCHYIGNGNLETLLNAIEASPQLTKQNGMISNDNDEASKCPPSFSTSTSSPCHYRQFVVKEYNGSNKNQIPTAMSISSLIESDQHQPFATQSSSSIPLTPPDTFSGLSTTPIKSSPNSSSIQLSSLPPSTPMTTPSPIDSIQFIYTHSSSSGKIFQSSFSLPSMNQAVGDVDRTRNSQPSLISNSNKRKWEAVEKVSLMNVSDRHVEKSRSKICRSTEGRIVLNAIYTPPDISKDELSMLSPSSPSGSSPKEIPRSHDNNSSDSRHNASNACQLTTVTCYHASVAQKSYGSEKRFLCPPPVVILKRHNNNCRGEYHTKPEMSMSVECEGGEKSLERKTLLDENMKGTFKYLHVSGTAKAKHFTLKLKIFRKDSIVPHVVYNSFPVTIISKPSKKTVKARNVSSCILSGTLISLFNRINSQTVRTKYMCIEGDQLCAKNSAWSPFIISVVNNDNVTDGVRMFSSVAGGISSNGSNPSAVSNCSNAIPITYGSEITLSDPATGFISDRLIIRKVEKGKIIRDACGPVSQMQKIALQNVRFGARESYYLSAAGSITMDGPQTQEQCASPFLGYRSSGVVHIQNSELAKESFRVVPAQSLISCSSSKDTSFTTVEEVDDYLCWTIVGISKFQKEYSESSSLTRSNLT